MIHIELTTTSEGIYKKWGNQSTNEIHDLPAALCQGSTHG
jgi:hypothetical protein